MKYEREQCCGVVENTFVVRKDVNFDCEVCKKDLRGRVIGIIFGFC